VHVVWGQNAAYVPDYLELLLNEIAGDTFAFRRDPTITLSMARAILHTLDRLPYLAPEFALLYKSKYPTMAENLRDFDATLPALDAEQRDWFRSALAKTQADYPWLIAFG